MSRVVVKSNGKINIGLNITGILENGYHTLDMTMIPISLADTLIIDFHNELGDLTIKSSNLSIPLNENNILYKVYNRFYKESKLPKERVTVELEKIIPMEAGLGGGSSNGAFFIKEINRHHNNFIPTH